MRRSFYGSGVVPILLDSVICRGNESNLLLCQHNGLGIHDCDSSSIAGVICNCKLFYYVRIEFPFSLVLFR